MASLKRRNGTYYIQYYVGERQKRVSLKTEVLQIAKEKLRQFESAELRGADSSLPTRTPIGRVVQAYAEHIRLHKTAKSAQVDIYYLREAFGAVCPALEVTGAHNSEVGAIQSVPPLPAFRGVPRPNRTSPKPGRSSLPGFLDFPHSSALFRAAGIPLSHKCWRNKVLTTNSRSRLIIWRSRVVSHYNLKTCE